MSDASAQNPFAPPRAQVTDPFVDESTELAEAPRMSRLLALLIDTSPVIAYFFVGLATFGMSLLEGALHAHEGSLVTFGVVTLAFCAVGIAWLAWTLVLLHRQGQTIGKKALGIRVVRMDGNRASFARLFLLRWLAFLVPAVVLNAIGRDLLHYRLGIWPALIRDALPIFGGARRCLHDRVADTRVVTADSSRSATLHGSLRA